MRSLYWIRSDLRLYDNQTFARFCSESNEGICLWTPNASYRRAGLKRKEFIDSCVASLAESLSKRGQKLIVSGQSIDRELIRFQKQYSLDRIYYSKEFASEELAEEKQVLEIGKSSSVEIIGIDQSTMILETDLPFELAKLPRVFTDFKKKVEVKLTISALTPEPLQYPVDLSRSLASNPILPLVTSEGDNTEESAQSRLRDYLWGTDSIRNYYETRNGLLDPNDSSRLSRWINSGCLSARHIHHELLKYENARGANKSTYWLRYELLWRDYFKFLSRLNGSKIFRLQGLRSESVASPEDDATQKRYRNWCEGKTTDRFVNANMNELNETAWMSGRGRQNVASYLIHQLQVPWTWGAQYFEKMLIDYDPDLNWGNWLYLSGRGTDPRSRVFNTALQAQMYDPEQKYQTKWSRS